MNNLKIIIYLLLITVIFSDNVKAQSSSEKQKITITNFKVNEKNDQIFIDWSSDRAVATNYWQIQSSKDGKEFSTFALVFGPKPRFRPASSEAEGSGSTPIGRTPLICKAPQGHVVYQRDGVLSRLHREAALSRVRMRSR